MVRFFAPVSHPTLRRSPRPAQAAPAAYPGLVEGQRREAADGHVIARLLHQRGDIGAQRLDLQDPLFSGSGPGSEIVSFQAQGWGEMLFMGSVHQAPCVRHRASHEARGSPVSAQQLALNGRMRRANTGSCAQGRLADAVKAHLRRRRRPLQGCCFRELRVAALLSAAGHLRRANNRVRGSAPPRSPTRTRARPRRLEGDLVASVVHNVAQHRARFAHQRAASAADPSWGWQQQPGGACVCRDRARDTHRWRSCRC